MTDRQISALRAYLVNDNDWDDMHRQLVQSGDVDGYGEVVYTAFVTAVRRRFSPTWSSGDVIRFVADARVRLQEESDLIDARAAENMIRRALDVPAVDNADQETKTRAQLLLLIALIGDDQLDDAGLDEFLDTVDSLTHEWFS